MQDPASYPAVFVLSPSNTVIQHLALYSRSSPIEVAFQTQTGNGGVEIVPLIDWLLPSNSFRFRNLV